MISNAAVMLFGGIETTEGMIANAVLHLLSHPDQLALVKADRELLPNAIEESLRLEPAAAVVDRYATADVELAGAAIGRGELVRVSIAGANRDPAVFPHPDRFDVRRRTPAGTSRSRTVRTSASGCTWRVWRPTPPSSSCFAACRRSAWTRPAPPRRAGSCSASRPSCASSGSP